MVAAGTVTGLVLAGGRGSRMGGADKGLEPFNGKPLALHALRRLHMQQGSLIGACMISANRNLQAYASFGVPVWPDTLEGYAGPLAGFLTGLEHCQTAYLLIVPCDAPLFPLDLASRLAHAVERESAELALASAPGAGGTLRTQPVFALLRADLHTHLHTSLVRYTQAGGRKVGAWAMQHRSAIVPFNTRADDPRAFSNANTLAELGALQT